LERKTTDREISSLSEQVISPEKLCPVPDWAGASTVSPPL
jgi:hypothetical protein